MNHWLKLGLPLGLSLLAALVSFATVSSKVRPFIGVRLTRDLERGAELTAEMLARAEISGDLAALPESAVAWEDRAILYNRPVPRSLKQGDLVLWRDATPLPKELPAKSGEFPFGISLSGMTIFPDFIQVGQQVGFLVGKSPTARDDEESPHAATTLQQPAFQAVGGPNRPYEPVSQYIGPFRVLAVGRRITPGGETTDGDRDREQILTIAARFVPQTERPDAATDKQISADAGYGWLRILGVVLHSKGDGADVAQSR